MLQFKLPAAHSVFRQAMLRALPRPFLLRAGIFGHEQDYGLRGARVSANPLRKRSTGAFDESFTCLDVKVIEISDFFGWGSGTLSG
jgi:hypothetical protein